MNITNLFNSEDRAVSPVIGVILMVAITVILAAVIGTFVLGLGDQVGDSAPQASFSTSDVESTTAETINFDLEKTGGQDIETRDLRVVVDGNDSTPDPFDVGDTWRTGEVESITGAGDGLGDEERVRIVIIHNPSGDQVYSTTITTPGNTTDA